MVKKDLFIILVEDSDEPMYWGALWDKEKFEYWRSSHPRPLDEVYVLVEEAHQARDKLRPSWRQNC